MAGMFNVPNAGKMYFSFIRSLCEQADINEFVSEFEYGSVIQEADLSLHLDLDAVATPRDLCAVSPSCKP
jgi:hypothetical protein